MGVAFGMMLGTVWHFKGANPQIRVFGISSLLNNLKKFITIFYHPEEARNDDMDASLYRRG
jgi:hypothetical protein